MSITSRVALYLAAFFVLLPGPSFGAISIYQQSPRFAFTTANGTTITRTFTNPSTNPSLLVALVTIEGITHTITSVSDGSNGSWNQDVMTVNTGTPQSGYGTTAIYSVQNRSTATLTVTLQISATSVGTITIFELQGAATSSALDKTASQHTASAGATIALALTGMAANDAIFSCITSYLSGNQMSTTVDTGFTNTGTAAAGSSDYHYGEYDVPYSGSGSLTLGYGFSGMPVFSAVAAAYKVAGGGPSGPPPSQFFLENMPNRHPLPQSPMDELAYLPQEFFTVSR